MSLEKYRDYSRLTEKISASILNNSVSHAYIIEGDRCIDKEAFARDFVKAVLCKVKPGSGCDSCNTCRKIDDDNYADLHYVRSENMSVKDAEISKLQDKLKSRPYEGERSIAIIEDADTMTLRAQNRLLKTLEEPYPGTIIILLSENTENLIQTITSRCIIYRLGNFVVNENNEKLDFAEKMFNMAIDGNYFYEMKNALAKGVKDKKEALIFIDAMERVIRKDFETGSRVIPVEKIPVYVKFIEEARRDLLANVNYKYAIRNMILKIGG